MHFFSLEAFLTESSQKTWGLPTNNSQSPELTMPLSLEVRNCWRSSRKFKWNSWTFKRS